MIKIIGFDFNNQIYTVFNDEQINSKFSRILVSSHRDTILMSDKDYIKATRLLGKLEHIEALIYKKFGYYVHVDSGFRTKKINKKVRGARFSQHKKWEAIDIHFYTDEKLTARILDKKRLSAIYNFLCKYLDDELRQIILYKTFIHVSLNTNRRIVRKLRKVK
jgi:uncharacterized protein YcbK (DUF882 family)